MSATFTEDVQALKELLLHNPVVLKLQGSQLPDSSRLQQYTIKCEEEDEFLLISTLLKLGLVRRKTLLLVGAVDRSYRKLKLFLEQFGIPASELPVSPGEEKRRRRSDGGKGAPESASLRSAAGVTSSPVQQGFYDIIIATKTSSSLSPPAVPPRQRKEKKEGKRRERTTRHSAVLHLTHGAPLLAELEEALSTDNSESVLKPDQFRMEEIQGFRYRCPALTQPCLQDAMRAVTKQAVREARLKEIKQEKLKTYFHDNPRDLQLLRHDKDLHPAVVKPHMKNIPE
ncbi:hypothetical protein OJAV_G00072030 [Oryzias javanicus]|uniref:RNA helicase n=1 Tax=Oryzias javanicus TaxID=123683 RepID=A0A437D8M6_ORYJA|nr:hypothetical protein OJAV_G00072030 [Oryzias javanicus]